MANLKFETAFKYPFNRIKGMLNILWFFLPIIGWFALGGYTIRIVKEFIKGQFKQLPVFNFKKDLKLGFLMFIKAIPFILAYTVLISILGLISEWLMLFRIFFEIFVIPILLINFFNKETVKSFFEFKLLNVVFDNLWDYVLVLLKSILLALVFLVLSIVLIGIPAGVFTRNIYLADFYRRRVK